MSEVAIVGGGLAGGAAALALAAAGHRVHLIEREAEPADKVCGEFLAIDAQRRLAALGLDLAGLGAAPIATLRLTHRRRTIERPLPFTARGLSRRRLDAALLDRAAAAGARIDRGIAARAIRGGIVETVAGPLAGATLILASGKHDVRGAARETAGADTGFVGFKSHWRLSARGRARLAGAIEVALFDGGYAGLQPVEGGLANLCLAVRKPPFAALGGWPALIAELRAMPRIAAILDEAEMLGERPLAIAGVPYGYLTDASDGAFRIGDQAGVIPSFCGEGMGIALHSAAAAAATIAGGGGAADHHARLRRDLAHPIRTAMRVQRLGEAAPATTLMALRLVPGLLRAAVHATRSTRQ